ncbi:MAG: galactose oxidase [Opitutae bacterium]|nr:galactose oxidase [Opitutae bacterium]
MIRFLFLLSVLTAAAANEPLAVPDLPQPLTNHAVAAVVRGGRLEIFTFLGLGAGKTGRDITNRAWAWREGDAAWRELPPVPVVRGRLASTACAVAGKIYLFGGYTVDEKGGEVSTPEVFCFDPATETYAPCAPMPVPVDDAVSLVYADRYVYLVSGWHDTGNTHAVQIYDPPTDTWRRATDYPGPAVFGHAGGIVGRQLVIAGGVQVLSPPKDGLKYAPSGAVFLGTIDPDDGAKIVWRELPGPGLPLYRMAACGDAENQRVVFAGGTARPYNYDGIGYDRVPSEASARVVVCGLGRPRLEDAPAGLERPSMDHRGLISHRGFFYLVGGMAAGQIVTARVASFTLGETPPLRPR